ncbi:hypothetical protein FRACYDRAFT_253002 [Fragilariopsis cylindrus CCMP1102]|uniref:Uncharacterized protein n=1 Tax=Fragilariopsis cylindrus CCMP1102 TaxID=635003 RepID=A0A1E7ELP3_9STRA|nr:hypothetical protein FRACYDRAFT_253002 [Fragilariopsis cylindrus CCMP1102]|eukprot:OEU06804.1 hypothetical protein FRACYDRAFT_253002 [Fragilariopsis cylindrus CCMP1102]
MAPRGAPLFGVHFLQGENTRKFFVLDAPTAFIRGNNNNLEEPPGKIRKEVQGLNPARLKSTKNYLSRGVPCELEARLIGALGGLVYFMSIYVDVLVKISVGAFFKQQ